MSISFEKKSGKKQRGGGFYVAVALCCAAVCLAAWSTVLGNEGAQTDPAVVDLPVQEYTDPGEEYPVMTDELAQLEQLEQSEPVSDDTVEWVSTEGELPDVQTMSIPTQPEQTDEAVEVSTEPVSVPPVFMMPVAGGEMMKAFSAGSLVYCETMGDWRVHDGVDVACAEGEEVVCACSGTVYSLYEDALYGNTAVIEHADGSLLYYCGLADFSRLSQGMKLSAGDLMGTIGIIPCEAAQGPHLHLSLMRDGGYVEPLGAMGLE